MSEDMGEGKHHDKLTALCIESDVVAIHKLEKAAARAGINAVFFTHTQDVTLARFLAEPANQMPSLVILNHKGDEETDLAWLKSIGTEADAMIAEGILGADKKPLLIISSARNFTEKELFAGLSELVKRLEKRESEEAEAPLLAISNAKDLLENEVDPEGLEEAEAEIVGYMQELTSSINPENLSTLLRKISDRCYLPKEIHWEIEDFVRNRKPDENIDPLLALSGLKKRTRKGSSRLDFIKAMEAEVGDGVMDTISSEIDNLIGKVELRQALEAVLDLITIRLGRDHITFTHTTSEKTWEDNLEAIVSQHQAMVTEIRETQRKSLMLTTVSGEEVGEEIPQSTNEKVNPKKEIGAGSVSDLVDLETIDTAKIEDLQVDRELPDVGYDG